jgi:hypothetical protein
MLATVPPIGIEFRIKLNIHFILLKHWMVNTDICRHSRQFFFFIRVLDIKRWRSSPSDKTCFGQQAPAC